MIEMIRTMYKDANKRVLDVLFKKEKLCERVASLQDCLMIGKGDWLSVFLDSAKYFLNYIIVLMKSDVLNEETSKVNLKTIKSLMMDSFEKSSLSTDVFKDTIDVGMKSISFVDELLRINGVSAKPDTFLPYHIPKVLRGILNMKYIIDRCGFFYSFNISLIPINHLSYPSKSIKIHTLIQILIPTSSPTLHLPKHEF